MPSRLRKDGDGNIVEILGEASEKLEPDDLSVTWVEYWDGEEFDRDFKAREATEKERPMKKGGYACGKVAAIIEAGKVIRIALFVTILTVTHLSLHSATDAQDLQRGLRNYQSLITGQKSADQLSADERLEVMIIMNRLRSSDNNESSSCRSALSTAEMAANELADNAKRLASCASAQDYTEDCSSRFRRVRSSYSDYESAVSQVQMNCRN